MDNKNVITCGSLTEWFSSFELNRVKRGPIKIDEWFEGRYQIDSILGYGHTSVVFRALDTHLERSVAIKIWHNAGYGIEPAVLQREGRFLARLNHPNVVRVYDYGADESLGRPWTVLEYLGPTTLYDLLKTDGHLSGNWERIEKIGSQVAAILDYLHNSASLCQLDLKPGNISIKDDEDTIKLMDLGSAYVTHDKFIKRYGTPGYIAPELFQIDGLSPKCDIFSLGVLLLEMIRVSNPFEDIQKRALGLDDEANLDSPSGAISQAIVSISVEVPLTGAIPLPGVRATSSRNQGSYRKLLKEMKDINIESQLIGTTAPSDLKKLILDLCAFDPERRPTAHEARIRLSQMAAKNDSFVLPSVFVSHSHLDKNRFVKRFAAMLERKGVSVWMDEKNLRTGEPFWERIAQAIESCDFVVVVLSTNSVNSSGVSEEIRTAHIHNIDKTKILPIRIDPIDFPKIPRNLRSRHVLDFVGWEDDKVLRKRTDKLVSDLMSLHNDRVKTAQ